MPGEQPSGLTRPAQDIQAQRDVFAAGRDQFNFNFGRPAEPSGPPRLLPRDVPGFVGRNDELARLEALARGGSVVVTAIDGTAGVGKTALAIHAAHKLLDTFPDGQLYADLRGYTEGQKPAEPGEILAVFLGRLGVPADEMPADLKQQSGLFRQWRPGIMLDVYQRSVEAARSAENKGAEARALSNLGPPI